MKAWFKGLDPAAVAMLTLIVLAGIAGLSAPFVVNGFWGGLFIYGLVLGIVLAIAGFMFGVILLTKWVQSRL